MNPRFSLMSAAEPPRLEINVDVRTEREPIKGPEELDPRRYAAMVESGRRGDLLLPALEGVNTVACRIEIVKRTAGIGSSEPAILHRFEVRRFR